jgi:hypothetical protein
MRLKTKCARDHPSATFFYFRLFRFVGDSFFVFATDKFNQSHFSAIAFARAELVNSRVSARTIRKPFSQFRGDFLQRGNARCAFSALIVLFAVRAGVSGKKRIRRLARGVNSFGSFACL